MSGFVTVSQINRFVKSMFDAEKRLKGLYIRGEISNFSSHYKSGHCYFSLKDNASVIKAVMFRSSAQYLKFQPENGMEVLVRADVAVYERDGVYQLIVSDMQPFGVGALSIAFEQLKQRLAAEGLFAPEHKKAIPKIPDTIAVITSKTGAAFQDICNILSRRFPNVLIRLLPVSVQGANCAAEVTAAVKYADQQNLADVIIIARGGGSQEDLWAFNDEQLARTVFDCKIPVISAIGHEIDFTILDFVADLRAPTPSAAAELAVVDRQQYRRQLSDMMERMSRKMSGLVSEQRRIINQIYMHKITSETSFLLHGNRQELQFLIKYLQNAMHSRLILAQNQFKLACAALESVNPVAILAKGYAAVYTSDSLNKQRVYRIDEVPCGASVRVVLQDGYFDARVETVCPDEGKIVESENS